MYNFALAFVILGCAYVIGEVVSKLTKAWIPSVFVTAIVMLIGYWTVFPYTLVSDTGLYSFAGTLGCYLLITHMGTVISIKQLIEQWKTIVVCLAGLVGMVALAWFVGGLFIDKTLLIAGIPPLTGGIVAATTMQTAATEAGLTEAAVFAISMYCIQGFIGYPITAICLKLEGKKLLAQFRSDDFVLTDEDKERMANVGTTAVADDSDRKTLLPKLPDKWNTPVVMLLKLGIVAWFATLLGTWTGLSGAIWCLILGVFFTYIGFLDTNLLTRANSYQFVMFALFIYVFDGLKDATPSLLFSLIGPMVVLIICGVGGMALGAFIISKLLKMSFPLAFANGLTALYGFPCDAIITEASCNSMGETEEEVQYLMSKMFPSMIVGGFVTVTITSVFLAGIFAGML